MIYYGDHPRRVTPRAELDGLARRTRQREARGGGDLASHTATVGDFIAASSLAAAVADAAFWTAHAEPTGGIHAALLELTMALARCVRASWWSAFATSSAVPASVWTKVDACADALPPAVEVRLPEGYAFYALFPEKYLEAARRAALSSDVCVIGLRGIGLGLAALVAVECGADVPISLRPFGHPFARRVEPSADDSARIVRASRFAIVDEGPGLSGSSFGATVDMLLRHGVGESAIRLFPSHPHAPGTAASEAHRNRWTRLARTSVSVAETILASSAPRGGLAAWVSEIAGPLRAPLQDLSAGAWRDRFTWAEDKPAASHVERLKYLARGSAGDFLVTFAGVGPSGDDRATLQSMLSDAGFVARPAGVAHGFMVTSWIAGTPMQAIHDRGAFLERVADYLSFRACLPAGDRPGASAQTLADMIAHNLRGMCTRTPPAFSADELAQVDAQSRPVLIDGRMQAWKWIATPDGRWLKADAVDHHADHGLIGCQDIAWDVAAAIVEYALDAAEADRLCSRVAASRGAQIPPRMQIFLVTAYVAFQIGAWTYARDAHGDATEKSRCAAELTRYEHALSRLADDSLSVQEVQA